jgi:hypothetical protein
MVFLSMATWEDLEPLRQQFPKATAWGQAIFQERGSVTERVLETAESTGAFDEVMGHRVSEQAHQPSVCEQVGT